MKYRSLFLLALLSFFPIYVSASIGWEPSEIFSGNEFEYWIGDYDNDGRDDLYIKSLPLPILMTSNTHPVSSAIYPYFSYLLSDIFSSPPPINLLEWKHDAKALNSYKTYFKVIIDDFNKDGKQDVLFINDGNPSLSFLLLNVKSQSGSLDVYNLELLVIAINNQHSNSNDTSHQIQNIASTLDHYLLKKHAPLLFQKYSEEDAPIDLSALMAEARGPIIPGAIAGSSSVSELDGTYSYSMPIALPSGPSGITPKLSIAYNSSGQASIMGIGFQFSGSSVISECNAPNDLAGKDGQTRITKKQLCIDGTPLVSRDNGTLYPENNPGIAIRSIAGGYESESLTYERRQYKQTLKIPGRRDTQQWHLTRVEDPFGNGYNVEYNTQHGIPKVSKITYNDVSIHLNYIDHPFPKTGVYLGFLIENDKLLKSIHIKVGNNTYRTYDFGYEPAQKVKNVLLNKIIECGSDGTCLQPTTFQYPKQDKMAFGFESNSQSTGGICADGSHKFGRCDSPAGAGDRDGYDFDGTGNHGTIQYADANGDGYLDICYRSDAVGIRCQLNDGNNNFPEKDNIISTENICDDHGNHKYEQCDNPENFGTIRFIDFNKDGKADAVYRGDTNGVHIIPNVNGKFDVSKGLITNMCVNSRKGYCDNGNNYYTIAYPELNGDSIPDICYRADDYTMRCKISVGIDHTNSVPIYSAEISVKVYSKKVSDLQVDPMPGQVTDYLLNQYDGNICGDDKEKFWGGCHPFGFRFVDFDTDGLDDLVIGATNSFRIFRSNGKTPPHGAEYGYSFQLFEPYLVRDDICDSFTHCHYHRDTIQLIDFNNDGWLDLCYESNGKRANNIKRIVTPNTNTGGNGRSRKSSDSKIGLFPSRLKGYICESVVKVQNNIPDRIIFPITTDGIITWVRGENGIVIEKPGIEPPKSETDTPPGMHLISHMTAKRWVDLDADGDLDLYITTKSLREQYFLLEKGQIVDQGFLKTCQSDGSDCDKNNIGSYQFVDINHDMAPDIFYRNKSGVRFRLGTATNTYKLNKLAKIENGMGLVTNVSYKRFKGNISQPSAPISSTSLPAPSHARLVVDTVKTNTIGGSSMLRYEYGEARRDSQRNKLNGFSSVKVTKSVKTPEGTYQPVLRTENTYAIDSSYLSGSLLKQKRYSLSLNDRFPDTFSVSERLISETTNQWGLFVDKGIIHISNTQRFFRQDLYRAAIIKTTTQDYGWVGTINDGRLSGSATWGPISEVEQSSNYGATRLSGSNNQRYGRNARLYQLQGHFNGNPVAMEMQGGKRVEKDLINRKTHTIFTENEFYSGQRSRLKKTKVTKDYQRLDGTKARSVKISAWEYYNNGQMKKEIVEPGNNLSSVTEYSYDQNTGQRTHISVKGKGIQANSTQYEYDQFLRVTKVTNTLGHTIRTQYDGIHGMPAKVIDANGLVSTTEYDGFGRVIKTRSPNGVEQFTEFAFSTSEREDSTYKVRNWDTLGNESEIYHAPTGQVIYSKSKTFKGEWIETLTQFDHYSQVKRSLNPRFIGDGNAHWNTIIKRDYLGATVEAENAAGHRVKTRSTARFIEETNAKGQIKTSVMDMKGNLHRVFDNNRNELQYLYSPDGQLLELKDVAGGHSIKMTYDKLGNKTQIDDPDKGRIKYWYNAAGQQVLSEQAGVKICQAFDKLGRTIRRHDDYKGDFNQALNGCEGNTSGIITYWQYDTASMGSNSGKGLLHKVSDSQGYLEEYKYDSLGRVIESTFKLKGKTFTERFQYDDHGRLKSHTYPSGFEIENHYDGNLLTAITNSKTDKTYWQLSAITASGQPTHQLLANGYNVNHHYDEKTGLLLATSGNLNKENSSGELISNSVHAMRFKYDSLGNILEREDLKTRLKETFSYDGLNRLRGSKVFGSINAGIPVATDSVSYFENGNIRHKSDAGTYTYGKKNDNCRYTPGPHAISKLVNGQNVRNFCYDARGNMLTDGLRQVTYAKAHDKPIRIQTNSGRTSVEFNYGPSRGRYYRKDNERGKVTETYYAGSGYEVVLKDNTVRQKHYIGSNVVEIHTYEGKKPKKVEERYLLKDHLGSIVVVGDAEGNVLEHHNYDAWGKKRSLDWRKVSGLADPDIEPRINADPGFDYLYGDLNKDGHLDIVKKAKPNYVVIPSGGTAYELINTRDSANDEVFFGSENGFEDAQTLPESVDYALLSSSMPEGMQAHRNDTTARGFTGHEHIESLGLVHMNGRVYDPLLGRFLSADPFVQAPTNTQSPNRYSYVFNNPLSFTDPTGYLTSWGGGLFGGIFGTGPAMLGAMFPSRLGSSLAQFDYWMHTDQGLGPQLVQTGMRVVACTYGTAVGCAAASGAMTYWLTDGDLSQGIKAAAIAFASASIADGIGDAVENGIIDHSQAAWLHGFSQGGLGVIGAGKFTWRNFGSSFASGYVGHAMGRFENPGVDIFLAGSLGGVTSRIAGGSFSDGFMTAAMVRIFNRHAHEDPYASDCSPGDGGCEQVNTAPDGTPVYRTQGAEQVLVLEHLAGRGIVGGGYVAGKTIWGSIKAFFGYSAAKGTVQLSAKNSKKLGQQIGRWKREMGGQGGAKEFLDHASKLATEARQAGSYVTGKVGYGSGSLGNATIYRRGNEYLVEQGGQIMSYVPNAGKGGIVDEFIRLGGK